LAGVTLRSGERLRVFSNIHEQARFASAGTRLAGGQLSQEG
jgi:hypothetical protein